MRWRLVGPAAAVLVAFVAGVALTRGPVDGERAAEPREPVAVTSNATRLTSLEKLLAAADLVVRAEVVATERGRLFGKPGGAAVESRLVTLEVAQVLAGTAPTEDAVLVEEEGWLEDGTPLIVDGAAPSARRDDGIWFLVEVGDPDVPVYVVLSAQGRYLLDRGELVGATGDDPLITELAGLSVDALADRITASQRAEADGMTVSAWIRRLVARELAPVETASAHGGDAVIVHIPAGTRRVALELGGPASPAPRRRRSS